MEVLNALDDEQLEQIIRSNYSGGLEIDYEVYGDLSSVYDYDNTGVENLNGTIFGNCTETLWNVTLVPRSLRMNHHYKVVRKLLMPRPSARTK